MNAAVQPAGHVDKLAEVLAEARRWRLAKSLVHMIDSETDSVGHYREWSAKGHQFLVRGDDSYRVYWNGAEYRLREIVPELSGKFEELRDFLGNGSDSRGRNERGVAPTGNENACRTEAGGGYKKKIERPGKPLPLRLVVTQVVDDAGVAVAE